MRHDHGGQRAARVDASVNVNPLGPPDALNVVFAKARELAARYPEIDAGRARDAWASRLGIGREQLLVGNGASELISLAIRAIEPQRVVVFDPCYSEYEASARAAGVPVEHVALQCAGGEWVTDLAYLRAAPGDLVVLGRPNNPTGHLGPAPDALAALANRGVHVLVDESFLALSDPGAQATLTPLVTDNLTVVTSLTKTYCVPGLRLGILAGHGDLIARIGELRDPWSVNAIASEAAVILAGEDRYLKRTRELLDAERRRVVAALEAMPGLRVTVGVAPFVLIELPEPHESPEVCARMLARGVAVRDASTFPGLSPRWIRIGIRTPAENDAVLSALRAALAEARA